MSLINLTDAFALVPPGGALAAFNVVQIEHAEAYAQAAEAVGLPVVMQISENCVHYHRGLAPLLTATLAIATQAAVPVVVHLDHATDRDLIVEAIWLGATSVMFDGSALPDEVNRVQTAEVVAQCHIARVSVEAELGEVGGKDGAHDPGARTDPDQARRFVADTGVDALAVAVGSSHAMTSRTASLDLDLIGRLAATVPVPLVLHGSSGVDDAGLVAAVRAGMRKVNIATHLNQVFTRAAISSLSATPGMVDTRRYLGAARDAVSGEAARLQELLAAPAA